MVGGGAYSLDLKALSISLKQGTDGGIGNTLLERCGSQMPIAGYMATRIGTIPTVVQEYISYPPRLDRSFFFVGRSVSYFD